MYKREEKSQVADSVLVKLAKQREADIERWFGDTSCARSIPHNTLDLQAHAGQFSAIVAKIERGSESIGDAKTRYALAMRLTEVFGDLLTLSALLHLDLEESYKYVRAQNDKLLTEERKLREKGNTDGRE